MLPAVIWPSAPTVLSDDDITARAREFIHENPNVWRGFVAFTFDAIRAGYSKFSSDLVVHRLVWETRMTVTRGNEPFKINGHFTAIFARWFHLAYPQHAGIFETRKRHAGGNELTL